MCSNCYHIKGREKRAWRCEHTQKSHYAKGLCQNCYQINYSNDVKNSKKNIETKNFINQPFSLMKSTNEN